MDATRRSALGDVLLALAALAGSSLLFWGAADLPPPRFEPLGSAALPRILAAIITVLALVIGVKAILAGFFARPRFPSTSFKNEASEATAPTDPAGPARPLQGLAVLAALILYVASLDILRIPFVIATTIFMMALGAALGRSRLRAAAGMALLGLVMALAIRFVFSRYLYIEIG